jgi:50S ribosomal subunit-associated GTPase HflX
LDFEGEDEEMDEEWRSDTLAGSCVVKCRKISGTTFFTKGKLNDYGFFLRDNPAINVVFVNTTLTTMQQKKLEKRWNDII